MNRRVRLDLLFGFDRRLLQLLRRLVERERLDLFPVDIDRLGVIVPRGSSDVTLHFGRRRREVAIAVVFSALAMLVCASFLFRSRTFVAAPAR